MKYKIFCALFLGALAVVSGLLLNWGYTCPECWENPEWLLTAFKVVGYIGLVAYPALAVREWTDEERFEEEENTINN